MREKMIKPGEIRNPKGRPKQVPWDELFERYGNEKVPGTSGLTFREFHAAAPWKLVKDFRFWLAAFNIQKKKHPAAHQEIEGGAGQAINLNVAVDVKILNLSTDAEVRERLKSLIDIGLECGLFPPNALPAAGPAAVSLLPPPGGNGTHARPDA